MPIRHVVARIAASLAAAATLAVGFTLHFAEAASGPIQAQDVAPNLAAASVAVASVFSLFCYGFLSGALLIITQPTLFFGNRKGMQFGTVFNSQTRTPIGLASVRLSDANGRVIQTSVTDAHGRYWMVLPDGTYRLDVRKADYSFPSTFATAADPLYHNVLLGDEVTIVKGETFIRDIPLDPPEIVPFMRLPLRINVLRAARFVQGGLSLLGPGLAVIAVALTPTPLMLILFGLQCAFFVMSGLLQRPPKPKSFGVISDERGYPMRSAIVRLFDVRYHKLLDSQLTDRHGQYGFLARKGDYEVTVEANGYATWKGSAVVDIDGSRIVLDVRLQKKTLMG